MEATDISKSSNEYLLINNGSKVAWQDYYSSLGNDHLSVIYKKCVIFEHRNVRKVQIVIDVLTKFNQLSTSELDLLVQKSHENEKTEIEIIIEKLKKEKAELEEQMKIFKEIQSKKEEIKVLISKLT